MFISHLESLELMHRVDGAWKAPRVQQEKRNVCACSSLGAVYRLKCKAADQAPEPSTCILTLQSNQWIGM